jgi:protein tyrosine phosphatase
MIKYLIRSNVFINNFNYQNNYFFINIYNFSIYNKYIDGTHYKSWIDFSQPSTRYIIHLCHLHLIPSPIPTVPTPIEPLRRRRPAAYPPACPRLPNAA